LGLNVHGTRHFEACGTNQVTRKIKDRYYIHWEVQLLKRMKVVWERMREREGEVRLVRVSFVDVQIISSLGLAPPKYLGSEEALYLQDKVGLDAWRWASRSSDCATMRL